ncbi:MAG: S8 family serine peptidase [candidate division Zixibacteria bacterium]|nr:S8 family serine peptidase [candidate division Zixibacteria bacterium]
MQRFLYSFLLILLLIISIAAAGNTGELDDYLKSVISESSTQEKVPVIIMLSDRIDIKRLNLELSAQILTRQQRHEIVVTTLQEKASSTQHHLLTTLHELESTGKVSDIKPFWIINGIGIKATPQTINNLVSRDDIDKIRYNHKVELIEPVKMDPGEPPDVAGIENGLKAVKADSMWAMGYRGQGRLVCNFDTGVEGDHPALESKWRGRDPRYDGNPGWAWFDTTTQTDFPFDDHGHGTHTMGTICGLGSLTGDTIGVAFLSEWIAAGVIDRQGGDIMTDAVAAFQWCADPDGDPETVWDVPDVCSNSWGLSPEWHNIDPCDDTFWEVIDACEAATVIVIFAAGNEGPDERSLRTPPDRATSSVSTLAVGAIDGNDPAFPIANFSSRGPCNCTIPGYETIKPDIVAPGVNVRSSVPGGGYEGGWSGTSMACPHVAGGAALLRQIQPDATVEDIKYALYRSARDLGAEGEDNNFGRGIIDLPAAARALAEGPVPDLVINEIITPDDNDSIPFPGETVDVVFIMTNRGQISAENTYAKISTSSEYANVIQDSSSFGIIAPDELIDNFDQPFEVFFSEDTPIDYMVEFTAEFFADNDFYAEIIFKVRVSPLANQQIVNHDIGNVTYTVSNFAQSGFAPQSINPLEGGKGFRWPLIAQNRLFEGSLILGTGPEQISSGARHQDQSPGNDFIPLTDIEIDQPGLRSDQDIKSSFTDAHAVNPMGIVVKQISMAFTDTLYDDFVIVEYKFKNEGSETIENLYASQFVDWNFVRGEQDVGNLAREHNLGYMWHSPSSNYRGIAVLNAEGISSYVCAPNNPNVTENFSDEMKWSMMTAGFVDTTYSEPEDGSMMITTGPFTIESGEIRKAVFAYIGARYYDDIILYVQKAAEIYEETVDVNDDFHSIPHTTSLHQNYPNPFNPATNIDFSIPSSSKVKLEVFNVMGQKVTTLVDKKLHAGKHSVKFDGSKLASGIYYYKLSAVDKTVTRRMVLIK